MTCPLPWLSRSRTLVRGAFEAGSGLGSLEPGSEASLEGSSSLLLAKKIAG